MESLYSKPSALLAKLLIQMLGHCSDLVRTSATILLNIISDTHPWQSAKPFKPKQRLTGDKFALNLGNQQGRSPVYVLLSCYSFNPDSSVHTLTWHRVPKNGIVDFGVFTRCGFFDYQLVEIAPALRGLKK